MKIRVLGSHGSRLPGVNTSCFLIDDRLLIDAGAITATLTIEEQAGIDHIVLTHAHLDHTADLAFLVDNVFALRTTPLTIWGVEPVLDALQRYIFNDQIWPDFTRIENDGSPIVRLAPLPERENGRFVLNGISFGWRRTEHVVPTVGYLLEKDGGSVLFSGDTRETDSLWEMGCTGSNLKMVFVETSFPNRFRRLAEDCGHLTPEMLQGELKKLGKPEVPVKIFHMKPQFLDEIVQELESLDDPRLEVLQGGETFVVQTGVRPH